MNVQNHINTIGERKDKRPSVTPVLGGLFFPGGGALGDLNTRVKDDLDDPSLQLERFNHHRQDEIMPRENEGAA